MVGWQIGHYFLSPSSDPFFKMLLFIIGLLHGGHDLLPAKLESLAKVLVKLILDHLSVIAEIKSGAQ